VHPNDAGADSIAAIICRTYAAKATRVCCIGNSITQYDQTAGYLTIDAYTSKLGMLLGRDYLTQNDGVSGLFMQKSHNGKIPASYWTGGKLSNVFAFKPNVITIMLGTNDARTRYRNTSWHITDYKSMIDTLSLITPKPIIRLMLILQPLF